MKKTMILLLAVLFIAVCFSASAVEAKPGDTVTVSIHYTTSAAVYAEAAVNSLPAGLDFVSAAGQGGATPPSGIPGQFIIGSGLTDTTANGVYGTLTVKVSESAAPGTYTISVGITESYDKDFNDVESSAYFDTIVVVAGEEPTTEAPTTEAPTTEAPTTEKPTTEAPTTEKPTTEAPTTEKPTTEAPTTEKPTTEKPTTEKPTTEKPTTEKPTTEKPTTEKPTTEKPTTEAVVKYSMTACSLGLRFRDVSKLTKNWDMFTPVDLSKDGEQTFDLIAGNMHVIGKVKLTVKEGKVTVSVKTNSVDIAKKGEFLTFLPSLAETETLDQSKLTAYKFDEEIDIEKDLGGDTNVLLYILNRYYYTSDTKGVERFFPNGGAYKKLAETLKEGLE